MPESSINNLASVITYRDELNTIGIGISELQNLSSVSRKYGGLSAMLHAISAFENLKSIQDGINKVYAEKEQVERKVTALQSDIQTLQKEKEAIQRPLRLYDDLKLAGFDVTSLGTLSYTCRKYNANSKAVLEAVNSFMNLAEIQHETRKRVMKL